MHERSLEEGGHVDVNLRPGMNLETNVSRHPFHTIARTLVGGANKDA